MSFDAIRRFVSARPFKPLVFHLDNGEKQIVNHPEIIVTGMMIVSVDDHGQLIDIAPEAVSAVRYALSTNRRMRGGDANPQNQNAESHLPIHAFVNHWYYRRRAGQFDFSSLDPFHHPINHRPRKQRQRPDYKLPLIEYAVFINRTADRH